TIDPNLENTFTRRASAMVEHELVSNFGVRAGFVWVGIRDQRTNVNVNRPYSAYSVPIAVTDPGPDGRTGTTDDGQSFTAYNLAAQYVGLPTVNITQNVPGAKDNFYTFEVTGDKRMSNHW